MKKRLTILAVSAVLSLSFFNPVFAEQKQLLPACGGAGQDPCTICNLFELINNIILVVIVGLVPVAAGLVIAIAGFKMLINQNNAEVLEESKKIILMVIIGLVLIYGSFALVNAAFQGMGYIGGNPLEFNNVECKTPVIH